LPLDMYKVTHLFRPMTYLFNGLTLFNETWYEHLLSQVNSSWRLLAKYTPTV